MWVTGFSDGEGCFTVPIVQNKNLNAGWEVKPGFQIGQHKREIALLEEIKNFLGAGKIYRYGPQAIQLQIKSLKELELVFKHFHKYPLITKKRADLKLSLMVKEIIERNI